MIAGIVRPTGRPAEQAGLDLRLRPACACVKTYRRNALLGEWGIVRSKTTSDALLDSQVVFAKISEEFASHHGSQSLIARRGALNEAREVGRADHVEIDIERDVPTHLSDRDLTCWREPMRPHSSAPQHAKRTPAPACVDSP